MKILSTFSSLTLLSPFLSLLGCWVDLFYSKSQQGVWEANRTQTFLGISRSSNMDNCQIWLGTQQKLKHSGGLAKHPITFWTFWRGHVSGISTIKKVLFTVGVLFLIISEAEREREIFLISCVFNDLLYYDSLRRETESICVLMAIYHLIT